MELKNRIISIAILMFLIGTLIIISTLFIFSNYKLDIQKPTSLNDGWQYRLNEHEVLPLDTLPTRIEVEGQNTYKIEIILPLDFNQAQKMLIRTSLANLTVSLEGMELYQVDFEREKTYASTWHMIDIPQDSDGKTLEMTFSSPYRSMRGTINEVSYGDLSSLYADIFSNFGLRLSLGVLTLFIGATLVILSFLFRKEEYHVIYLGVSAVIFALWLISESRMLQFFIGNPNIIGGLAYIAIALFPAPLALYIKNGLIKDHKRLFDILAALFFTNTIIVIILHFSGILAFFETVPFSLALLVIALIIVLLRFIVEYRTYRLQTTLRALAVFSVLGFFAFLEVLIFSQSNFRRTSDFVVIGLGIILLIIFVGYVQFSFKNYKGSLERKLYEKLAYTDQLTGAFNRFAYFKDVEQMTSSQKHLIKQLVYFDLDNLKSINDTFGHMVGDQVIKQAYVFIKEHFKNDGKCYRMGGDEFVCMFDDKNQSLLQKDIDLFNEKCRAFDEQTDYHFSISIGTSVFDSNESLSISDALMKSDKNMYVQKQAKKNVDK